MKIVFVGPSLFGAEVDRSGIVFRGPARQGDIARAALQGATAIGLIDGVFASAAAVWHKEILYALSLGTRVLGAASMGALRAAECAPFGMEPIGDIAQRYSSGELDDDADVALTFGPEELGYRPLSEPMVDVVDKVERLRQRDQVTRAEGAAILAAGQQLYYADRSVQALFRRAFGDTDRATTIAKSYVAATPSAKQRDAIALLAAMRGEAGPPLVRWQLAEPPFWKRTLQSIEKEVANSVTIESRII